MNGPLPLTKTSKKQINYIKKPENKEKKCPETLVVLYETISYFHLSFSKMESMFRYRADHLSICKSVCYFPPQPRADTSADFGHCANKWAN